MAAIEAAWEDVGRAAGRSRAHERLVARAGVKMDRAGWALLRQMGASDRDLRVTDLADRLDLDPPAVTRKVQQLERAGLVSRAVDGRDRRASRLSLTPQGRKAFRRLAHAQRAQLREVLEGWDAHQLVAFAELLRRFAHDIGAPFEHDDPAGGRSGAGPETGGDRRRPTRDVARTARRQHNGPGSAARGETPSQATATSPD